MLYFLSGSEFTLVPSTATTSLHPPLSSWCVQTSSPGLPGFRWGLASGRHQQEFVVQEEREYYKVFFFPTAHSCCFSTSLLTNTYVFMENSLWTDNRRGKICRFGLKMGVEEMLGADRSKGCCCICWVAQVVACGSSALRMYFLCPSVPWLVAWEAELCWLNLAASLSSCISFEFSQREAPSQWVIIE